ncbi:hypothetical protein FJV76_14285 [Mesorhizobium sp. WSM4303]|uniref:hypothetical protein n=1 Tax=Mesorhizobium sp. WSM4303 TaxID=2589887 RepID=UPI00115D2436|nr:hypothetical protein [Mesorhizobium sp. WSM4303]TRD03802.1 hypothetical protein FJV76_14285 [Mesorhizobium sp. WSM4303]
MAEASNAQIIVLGFFTEVEEHPKKADPMNDPLNLIDAKGYLLTAPSGIRVMETIDVDWVRYSPAGFLNANTTESRVEHLRPSKKHMASPQALETVIMLQRWKQIEPAYDLWKSGNEIPVYGTPLSQWAGIKPAYIALFKQHGITTVEGVRDMVESHLERIKVPNIRYIKTEAGLFLESTDKAKSAAREADMQRRLQELEERNAAMLELLESQTKPNTEVDQLRAELDAKGIPYHHKAGAGKLRELLEEKAAA